ncbi:MAG: hypothetical protein EZS28_005200 [Streblomastix strix]|uniref:Tyr recombinase domain-containing protein n=1 Tax=Streblomastix strix TaxID=222440 RepID=A0A5J4WXS1_9EUKA|nr:MAG: hypothetical protein EZS28_005200 [Streblomastix strix]
MISLTLKEISANKVIKPRYSTIWKSETVLKFEEQRISTKLTPNELLRRTLALFQVYTTMRTTEIASMRREDVVFTIEGMLIQYKKKKAEKRKKWRAIHFIRNKSGCSVIAMKCWIKTLDLMLSHSNSLWRTPTYQKPLASATLRKRIKEELIASGVPISFGSNTIRHSVSTRIRAHGVSIQQTNLLTDHAFNTAVTEQFNNITGNKNTKIANFL